MKIIFDLYEILFINIITNNGYGSLYTFIFTNREIYNNYKCIENIIGKKIIRYYQGKKYDDNQIYNTINENNILGNLFINSINRINIYTYMCTYKMKDNTINALYDLHMKRLNKIVKNRNTKQRMLLKFFVNLNNTQKLTENIIRMYFKYFNKKELIYKQVLSEKFLWDYKEFLDFDIVFQHQNISDEFVIKLYNETFIHVNLNLYKTNALTHKITKYVSLKN